MSKYHMGITIIYLEDEMLISKKEYRSWREIQCEHEDYKASLGAWKSEEVVGFLNVEYANLNPPAETQVSNLLRGTQKSLRLTFND